MAKPLQRVLRKRGVYAKRHGLVCPLYVPKELRETKRLLSEGRIEDAALHLWRLACLGSDPAAATLGYLCLTYKDLNCVNCVAAIQLCIESAHRGDSFAQYVVAWYKYEHGDNRALSKWLNQSARQGFPPAIGSLGSFFISAPDKSKNAKALSKRFFLAAIRRGHISSIPIFLLNCKRGVFGTAYRVLGYGILPPAILFLVLAMWLYPFSVRVFAYPVRNK